MATRNTTNPPMSLLLVLLAALGTFSPALAQPADVPGHVTQEPDARIDYDAPLEALLENLPLLSHLSGLAQASLLVGVANNRVVQVRTVTSPDVRFDSVDSGALDITLRADEEDGLTHMRWRLSGAAGDMEATLVAPISASPETGALTLDAGRLDGTVTAQRLDLAQWSRLVPALPLGGAAEVAVSLSGTTGNPVLKITAHVDDLLWRGDPLGPTELTWEHADQESRFQLRIGDPAAPLLAATAVLPLDLDLAAQTLSWRDTGEHQFHLTTRGLTPEKVKPFWRAPAALDYHLNLVAEAAGTLDNLAASFDVDGTWSVDQGVEQTFHAALEVGSAEQKWTLELGESLLALELSTAVDLPGVRRKHATTGPSKVNGTLKSNLPLHLAAPFLPPWLAQPRGNLDGEIVVVGTLEAPEFSGLLSLEDAHLSVLPLNRRLEGVGLEVRAEGTTFHLSNVTASGLPGTVSGSGDIVLNLSAATADSELWSNWSVDADTELVFGSFPLIVEELPVALFDMVLAVHLRRQEGHIGMTARVEGGKLSLTSEKVPERAAIPSNPAVSVMDWLGRRPEESGFFSAAEDVRLEVSFAEPFPVSGQGYKLALGGTMSVHRTGPVVKVDGGLEILPDGELPMFKNRFEIKGGTLRLAEGNLLRQTDDSSTDALRDPDEAPTAATLDPIVDVVARGIIDDTHVMLKVRGPGSRPELVMRSVPPLPEYQILTLLILGRVDAVGDRNGQVRRSASKLVERFHNPSLKRQLFDRLGVDKVGLGFGSSVSEPIVTVGKQVTRKLYVETTYHHNAPPDANARQGRVQYRMTPRWTVDTTFGDAAEGGVGVFWGTSFGGPAPPPAPDGTWGLTRTTAPPDGDGDGVSDPFDLCSTRQEDADGFTDQDGCPDPDNDGDGVPDKADLAPEEAETLNGFEDGDGKPDVAPLKLQGLKVHLRSVRFPANGADLDEAAVASVRALALALQAFPEITVQLVGHSDNTGTEEVNLKVSLERARQVKQALERRGTDSARIAVEGVGYSQPLDPADTPEANERNRRVDVLPMSAVGSE